MSKPNTDITMVLTGLGSRNTKIKKCMICSFIFDTNAKDKP